MCGIAGIFGGGGQPVRRVEIARMCRALAHRGPDDEGIHIGDGIGLGMRRLSIIDLEHGRQPICNEDGTVWMVGNGEIYNCGELRRSLEARGHRFRSRSDMEVVVHLYEEYGVDCVGHLRGMFALAVWDAARKRLFLARDRVGIKPLYYTQAGGRLAFASELKSLLQLPEIERNLDLEAVEHLFTFMTTPASSSVVAGVRKLEPGHALLATPGSPPRVWRYWDVEFEPEYGRSEAYFTEGLRGLLDESVRLHLASDVPVGVFLSGGVDSGAVAATMAAVSPAPVKAFSIGYEDPRYDESAQARGLAEVIGVDHRELILAADAFDALDDIVWHLDEPFGDSSAIPTYMVSKLAAAEVKVVLSGDGGDELFAGYDKYRVERRARRYDAIPELFRRPLGGVAGLMPEGMHGRRLLYQLSLSGAQRYLNAGAPFRRENSGKLFTPGVRAALNGHEHWDDMAACLHRGPAHWLSRLQYFDLHRYLPLDILTKVDRMSMAHSLEVRVPLLDHKLIEFAARIPPGLHLRNGESKSVFKRALAGLLPAEVLRRPKRGFAVPLGDWFRGGLSGFVRDLLLSDTCRRRGVFDLDYVAGLIRLHENGRPQDLQLWALISFELWCRRFLDATGVDRCTDPGNTRADIPVFTTA